MAEAQIQKVSPNHEMMINWLIENPDRTHNDAAAFFGVSPTWFSIVTNSDAFQTKLKQRQDELFDKLGNGVITRLKAVSEVSLEKLGDMVHKSVDPTFVLESTEMLLKAQGMGGQKSGAPSTGGNSFSQQNNYIFPVVDKDNLAEARARIMKPTGTEIEGSVKVLPDKE